jgi:predicted acetyltransferase
MEKFYLEIPSLERKEEALDYLKEHIDYKSDINGTEGINRIKDGFTYEDWLDEVTKAPDEEWAKSVGRVPATTYFTIRESDNKIIGMVNFRHYLNERLRKIGGHIGYGIRPTERRKGYAKIQLYLALLEAQKLGLDKVMVDCIETNIGSERTILALGGEFEEKVFDETRQKYLKNYWINVNESIEKYKDLYGDKILKKKRK